MEFFDNGDGTFDITCECYDCGTTVTLNSGEGIKLEDVGFDNGKRGPVSWKFKGIIRGRKQFDKLQQTHSICGLCASA